MSLRRIAFTALHVCAAASLAAQGRDPKIEIVSIAAPLLTDQGVSATSFDVSYRIEFVPKDAIRAEVQVLRDGEVIRTFPAPLRPGLNTVTLPSGIQMENPFAYLTARITLADGKLSEPSTIGLYDSADFARRDLHAKARFDRLRPDVVTRGVRRTVELIGRDLTAVAERLTLGAASVDATPTGTGLRFDLPPGLFSLPGFHPVLLRQDLMWTPALAYQRLVLAVADPSLPRPGRFSAARIERVEYLPSEYNERLRVHGAGFRRAMQIVIGRGTTPIQAQPTDMESTAAVTTYLPGAGPGADYFVAILSEDKTQMTTPFRISSPEQMRAAGGWKPRPPEEPPFTKPGFRVFGDIAWNVTTAQWLYLEGPAARPGLKVSLRRDADPVVVEAVAAEDAPARQYPVARVQVPASLTRRATFDLAIAIHTK